MLQFSLSGTFELVKRNINTLHLTFIIIAKTADKAQKSQGEEQDGITHPYTDRPTDTSVSVYLSKYSFIKMLHEQPADSSLSSLLQLIFEENAGFFFEYGSKFPQLEKDMDGFLDMDILKSKA